MLTADRGDNVLTHLVHARDHIVNAIRHHLDDQPDSRDRHIDEAQADIRWAKRSVKVAAEIVAAEHRPR